MVVRESSVMPEEQIRVPHPTPQPRNPQPPTPNPQPPATIGPHPLPTNEPVLSYAPGTVERAQLKQALRDLSGQAEEIPLVIGGREVRTGAPVDVAMPHSHRRVLARVHQAGSPEAQAAIGAAADAWAEWSAWPFERRARIFLKAADLLAGDARRLVNAATMLGQSKTVHQSEIDAACEMVDFLRFNVHYAARLYGDQPISVPGAWNEL